MRQIPQKNNGDYLQAAEWNDLANESMNSITDVGEGLTSSNVHQLSTAMATYAMVGDFYDDTGSPNAYKLGVNGSFQAPVVYKAGMRARFIANSTNTGASGVIIESLGIVNLLDANGNTLQAGEIVAGQLIDIYFDGIAFRLYPFARTIDVQTGVINYGVTTTASANTYNLVLTPAIVAYVDGLSVRAAFAFISRSRF